MSLTAVNAEVMELFNHLLHDLYFEIPSTEVLARGNNFCAEFIDKEFCIHRDFAARYLLCVETVVGAETKGKIEKLPGKEAQLNKIIFRKDIPAVVLDCVHPFQIILRVRELRLSLDQISIEASRTSTA